MREKKVAVAVLFDDLDRFLLLRNARWHDCFALPMKDVEADEFVLGSTAIQALEKDLGRSLPNAQAKELGYVGKYGWSAATGEPTLYEYWAFEVAPGEPLNLPTTGDDAPRWDRYDNLMAGNDITWSTKEITRTMVENQEVALAVVTRQSAAQTEYLLVWSDSYRGLFLPCMRITAETKPEAVARKLMRLDFGYPGEVIAECRGAVEDFHHSKRLGRERAFRFHVCTVALPQLDLNQPLNLLERRLQARGLRWLWVTADQLANPPEPVSPTLASVRATILNLAPPSTRDAPIRRSEGGIALIRRNVKGHTEWLAQWNEHWQSLSLIGGHREGNESFRDCVMRETSAELGLTFGADFEVAPTPRAELAYVAYSRSAGEDTQYQMSLFDVTLKPHVGRSVEADANNCWLSEAEIRRLEAHDGRAVSATAAVLLTRAGLMSW